MHFVKKLGLAFAAITGVACQSPTAMPSTSPSPQHRTGLRYVINNDFSEVLSLSAKHHQFVNLADPNHGDIRLPQFMAKEKFMSALQKGGVKHIFLELDVAVQHHVDALADGEISLDEYKQRMSEQIHLLFIRTPDAIADYHDAIGRMILNAKKHGIAVHFADYGQGGGLLDISQRLILDGLLAKHIKEVAGSEKAVVVYGSLHSDGPDDLEDHLGHAITIELHGDIHSYAQYRGREASRYIPDHPELIIAIEDNTVLGTTSLDTKPKILKRLNAVPKFIPQSQGSAVVAQLRAD